MSYQSPLNDSTDLEKVTAFWCIVFMHHAKAIKMYFIIILSTENMTRGSIRVYQNARCSVKWFKNSVKKEIKQTHRITVHQWMVLRWWHAFYLFYGNIGCWKTDGNFSGRLRTQKTVQMTDKYFSIIQQITNNGCKPGWLLFSTECSN